ncbi:apolipoprotein N-acyltransferase [Ponticaulis profundi]|uniref:Apolipoprotein N-acyltransferase n=1 Tax=Ponticaulis profundi TaxID=2665222 RepID=A0ABW1S8L7_9PROT
MPKTDSLTIGALHNAIARLSPLRASMLALVCGVLTLFAFAPFQVWPVYVLAITLLVWLIDGARIQKKWRKAAFARGWFFGVGFTLASMHWLASPFLVEPEKHIYFIWMPLILMPAGLGLFFGLASFLAAHVWSRKPARIFALVVALSLTEWLRGHLFGGFPWNLPGTIWAPGSAISQLASVVGVWGLSVLTLFLATAPAALADFRRENFVTGRVLPIFAAAIFFSLSWGWGSARLTTPMGDDVVAMRLVDVGVPQTDKYPQDPTAQMEAARDILITYLDAMGDDFPDEPRIVVWPEAAVPITLLQDPNALDAVSARLGERILITGTPRIDRYAGQTPNWYNSLAVLTKNSRLRGAYAIYDKSRLVPFGELAAADFIPFGHSISGILPGALQRMATAGYTPGTPAQPIELPNGEKILPLICYEALFPQLVIKNSSEADFLINISIDSWFGGAIGPDQHFAQASFRAIESGKPLVRVANLGKSGLVDAFGREAPAAVLNFENDRWPVTVLDISARKTELTTTYSRFSNSLAVFILLIFSFICAIFGRQSR